MASEFCACGGGVWYPTDALGRLVPTCERCGARVPVFSPRGGTSPQAVHRDHWTVTQVASWVRRRLERAAATRPQLLVMASEHGVPHGLVFDALRQLHAEHRVRQTAGHYQLIGDTITSRIMVIAQQRRTPLSSAVLFRAMPDVPRKNLTAALSRLVTRGDLKAYGTKMSRTYRLVERPTQQEAA